MANHRQKEIAKRMRDAGITTAPDSTEPAPPTESGRFGIAAPSLPVSNPAVETRLTSDAAAGGIDYNPTAPSSQTEQPEPKLGLNELLKMSGTGQGGGGPATKTTVSRSYDLGPSTPDQAQQLEALGQQAAEATAAQTTSIQTEAEATAASHLRAATALTEATDQVTALQAKTTERKRAAQNYLDTERRAKERGMAKMAAIDPSDQSYWQERGSGSKIAAALAIFFGALGQAFSGGENVGLKIIQDTLQRNIEAKKVELAKWQGYVDERTRNMETARGQISDIDQELIAYESMIYSAAETKIRSYMEKAKSVEATEKGKQLLAELALQQTAAAQQRLQDFLGRVDVQQVQRTGGGGGKSALQVLSEALDVGLKFKKYQDNGDGTLSVPGVQGAVRKEDIKDVRKLVGDTKVVNGQIDTLIKMAGVGSRLNPKQREQVGAVIARLKIGMASQIAGALNEEEWKIIDSAIGDPRKAEFATAKLKTLKDQVNKESAIRLETYGLQSNAPQPKTDFKAL